MPTIQHARQELYIKLVYYGSGLSGKTTNVKHLYDSTKPEHRGKLLSLETPSERTLLFDLLPVALGAFRGYGVRLHVCTVPGQVAHDKTRRVVLRNADGVVFVADSQPNQLENNIVAMRNLELNLRLQGIEPDLMPLVVQYNKRDLPNALPLRVLQQALGVSAKTPQMQASALAGKGVSATLKRLVKMTLGLLGDPRDLPNGRAERLLCKPVLAPFPQPRDKPTRARAARRTSTRLEADEALGAQRVAAIP